MQEHSITSSKVLGDFIRASAHMEEIVTDYHLGNSLRFNSLRFNPYPNKANLMAKKKKKKGCK